MTTRFVISMTITQAAANARLNEVHRAAALRRQAAPRSHSPAGQRWRWPLLVAAAVATVLAAMTLTAASASAASAVYTNSTPITIRDAGTATPYPSSVSVSGLQGRVANVIVTLRQFEHSYPRDVDILLVSPGGKKAIVMSDACGTSPIPGRTWFVHQDASTPMPYTTQFGGCDQFFYQPTDFEAGDYFPTAPVGDRPPNFNRFIGDEPNGTWSLYVYDDSSGDAGRLAGGWSLTLETAPVDAFVPGTDGSGRANPYPVTRTVGGVDGVIKDIDVSLGGVYHQRPDDLDLLLVGPGGQTTMLMSDSCGSIAAKGLQWRWDDEAPTWMPDGFYCPSGTYHPSSYSFPDLPAPAPSSPYGGGLFTFRGSDPNGIWKLYAYDTHPGDADGFLAERFALDIKTRPRANVAFAENAVEVPEGASAELTLRRDAGGAELGQAHVTVTSQPVSASSGSDFEPIASAFELRAGQTELTVPVRTLADAANENDETFEVTIAQTAGDAQAATPSKVLVTIPGTNTGGGGATAGGGTTADASPPDTTIDKGPKARTKRAGARLRFSSTERGSTFECKVDKRKFKPCSSPRRLKRLSDGKHRFAVRAIDPAGNVDPTPAKRRWRVRQTHATEEAGK